MRYIPTPPYMNGTAYNSAVPLIGGGYSYYNPYLNPMYMQKQREEYERQQKQEFDNQVNVWKHCIRSTNACYGQDTDEEKLDKVFHQNDSVEYQEELQKIQLNNNCQRIMMLRQQQEAYYQQQEQYRLQQLKEIQEQEVEEESLFEFLRGTARERYIESLENRSRDRSRVKNLYDHSAYERLLGVHETNGTFNSLNPYISIDDLEIQLPQSLQTERELKRKQFMESIMSQEKGW